jgi:hypothetical protein
MAPPIRARKPVLVRPRRSAADMFFGLLAVLVLAVVLGGVPFALITVLGLPIPHNLPPLSVLTQRLDIVAILRILSVIIWLAWLQLSVCVLVEIRAAIRGVGLPARVPLSGHTQTLAHWLVAAALLLFSAGTAIAPVLVRPGPVPVHQTHAAAPVTAPSRGIDAELASMHTSDQQIAHEVIAEHGDVKKIYIVEAPEGRHHDSLWEIAERHLGDGRRYRQIFAMNSGRTQPDGSRLTIAGLIRPGWILDMPADAHGPGIKIVQEHPQPPALPGPAHPAPPAPHPASHPAPHPASHPAPRATGPSAPAQGGAPGAAVRAGHGQPGARGEQHGAGPQPGLARPATVPLIPYELSAASLLAAGVLAALGRRRREQLWRRAFGRRIPLPEGAAAAAETALRLGADHQAAHALDAGLRQMSRALAQQGRQPPAVFAAFAARDHLDLWLACPDPDPPGPWAAQDGGNVWRLPLSEVPTRARDEAGAALAPYPGLVSIGTNDDGRVLIDPGAAGGIISLRGPSPLVRGALAALAVELATSSWSDRLQLTLVGFGTELTLLAPGRVAAVRTLDEALPAVEARASEMAQALAASAPVRGMRDLGDGPYWEPPAGHGGPGNASPGPPGAHPPHYILAAVPPTAEQAERLRRLARSRYGAPIGCVVAGEIPGAAWTLDIAENGRLQAGELGLDLTAQVVPDQQYASVVELFRTAARTDGPALAPPELFAAPVAQLAPGYRSQVDIQILGPIVVNASGPIEPTRRAFATELVVYVATHPEGVHPAVLTSALWPRGAPGEVVQAAITRVREWLGTDDVGRPNLGADVSGRLRLGSQVRVDWQVFRTLVARAISAPGDEGRAEYLAQALALVRGQLLEGHDRSRYTWLATDGFGAEVAAWVADTAHQLAGIRLAARDPRGAMEAARLGLRLAGGDEMLWRDLLRSAHATGWEHVLRDVVRELSARVAIDPVLPRMAPQTEALIDELLPSWRSSVA